MRKCIFRWPAILSVILTLALSTVCVAAEKAETKPASETKASAEAKPPVNAAIVNGTPISYKEFSLEFETYKKRMMQQGRAIPEQYLPQVRTQLLQQLIDSELLLQDSKKQGITTKTEDVQKELDGIKARHKDPKEFEKTLAEANLSEKQLKEKLAENMAIKALLEQKVFSDVSVNDDEAKAFYDGNPQYFHRPEQVHARHILKKVEEGATEEKKAEARKALEAIKTRILAGEDFAELAKEYSDGPSKDVGGDLGYFAKGKMVKPFAEAAFALKTNEVSDIVETQFGYHIIKVLDHRDAEIIPFEKVKPRIIDNLKNQKMKQKLDSYLAELRKDAKVENFVQ